MDTYLAIASRREVRAYSDRPLAPETERRILDAGRVTGSAQNRQPWRFLVLEETRERAAEAVYVPANLLGAAFVVAIVLTGGAGGFDAGRVAQNMLLAAWNEGVGGCPNGVADRDALEQVLGLGEGEQVAIVLSFGHPARPSDPERRSPQEWIERAERRPFDDVVVRR
jgi:nitroreductase